MTTADVIALLRSACERAGGQLAWAKANGVSLPYVNDTIRGRREPGPAICERLGVERVITYRRVK